ncbi:MAG: hypothetical protein ACRCX8_01415 [Sarcina sp.]
MSVNSLGMTVATYIDIGPIEVCINRKHQSTLTTEGLSIDLVTEIGLTRYPNLSNNKKYRLVGETSYNVNSVIPGRITQLLLEGVKHG